jgi:hypothetical protein
MGEKPTAAFVLSLIAGILILLCGIFMIAARAIIGMALPWIRETRPAMIGYIRGMMTIMGLPGLIFGIIAIIGAFMIRSEEQGRVKAGSVMVLISSILSIFSGMGFVLGLVLGIVGGILGLTWKPEEKAQSKPEEKIPS